ncbi:MAG: glycosyltransferase, partial [Sedimenticola sp.]|nr:glycosyltransferase [Sedimenticola sp.]
MSTLSIVIPCLNEAAAIQRLLACLQPARTWGAELIVVDGGSHDETVQLAEQLVDR